MILLAGALAAAVVALPYLVSSDGVRAQIMAQAHELTGRRMSFRDAPKVFLSPYLGIEIANVIFEGSPQHPDDPPFVQMERLRGRIAVIPALFGRIEIYQYQLVRPRFSLRVDGDGRTSWAPTGGRLAAVLDQARAIRQAAEPNARIDLGVIDRLAVGDFEIVDGIVVYESAATGARETFTNVNAQLRWPDSTAAWTIRGSSIWRDESVEFSINNARPLLLMAGGSSQTAAEVRTSAFRFSFSGDANLLAGLYLAGTTTLSAPSLPRLVEFFGGRLDVGAAPGALQITGKLNGTPRQMQVADAVVSVDRNEGRGVLQVVIGNGGRPQINATLAFQSLDLTPYLAGLRQEAEIGRPQVSGLQLLDDFDCDVRLSASSAKLGNLTTGSLGAALSVRNGELLFDLGGATLYGGSAIGKLSLKRKEQGAQLRAEAALSGISLAPLIAALPRGAFAADGKADIKLTVKSDGSSVGQLASQLRGWATLEMGRGLISGADLGQMRATLASSGEDGAVKLSGQTLFTSLKGDMIFDRRTLWLRGLELDNTQLRARLAGRADLLSGGLALRARLNANDAGQTPDTLLFIGGVMSSPLVTRDTESVDGLLDPAR